MSASIHGHSARIHKDFKSKTKTRGFKIHKHESFGNSCGGKLDPQRNAGLAMPMRPRTTVPPVDYIPVKQRRLIQRKAAQLLSLVVPEKRHLHRAAMEARAKFLVVSGQCTEV